MNVWYVKTISNSECVYVAACVHRTLLNSQVVCMHSTVVNALEPELFILAYISVCSDLSNNS